MPHVPTLFLWWFPLSGCLPDRVWKAARCLVPRLTFFSQRHAYDRAFRSGRLGRSSERVRIVTWDLPHREKGYTAFATSWWYFRTVLFR